MIGDTVGLLTLLFWQGICSLNKDIPARPVTNFDKITQSPEKLADFVEDINGSTSLCDFCIHESYKKCGSIEEANCHAGIAEYMRQEYEEEE
jgi:hypothetical protein